ncbi:MAG: homoprotocatechuate degradation operon regulator HpaR [Pseudorhodoplanes sp.]|jgi:homoprotocatechuate degradation regulator HpaR|nr:homoprotocatechuate degradation operon regulator HpaR [Pseudorhodoplanes sp.]
MTASRMRPFERSLPMQLMLAREAVMQRFRPHLNAQGLTDQQWRIIRALNEVDEIEIVELGKSCCLHAASLSRILPKLEADGLILRRAHKNDQRRVVVSLTSKGRRLFLSVAPQSEAIYAALAREIGPAKLEQIYDLLDDVIDRLAQPHAKRGSAAARARTPVKRAPRRTRP